jgi:hypothetical protein
VAYTLVEALGENVRAIKILLRAGLSLSLSLSLARAGETHSRIGACNIALVFYKGPHNARDT